MELGAQAILYLLQELLLSAQRCARDSTLARHDQFFWRSDEVSRSRENDPQHCIVDVVIPQQPTMAAIAVATCGHLSEHAWRTQRMVFHTPLNVIGNSQLPFPDQITERDRIEIAPTDTPHMVV